ncbi:velvet factor [Hygrophoropsis aurantiaca]|uniref:Velvet factor n=1 Tax=Hygrophoropsis aurantiaca TaxID=72124 RepID=A0ACB8ARW4_9AGAM|nr:velvet factor [Hygrophoropsis aurantiaca]
MIQKGNPRPNIDASARQPPTTGIESWGQWLGRKHYSLEVVQNPLRARMCGFGDKDRRPLAPAAVAKMIVRREDNSLVDVDDIDCSFFLVTVDLWSADGKREMNLVLHPSSTERYVPTNPPKPRRRANAEPTPRNDPHSPTSSRSTPNPVQHQQRPPMDPQSSMNPMIPPQYSNQGYQYSQQPSVSDPLTYASSSSYGSPPDSSGAWGYPPTGTPLDRSQTYQNPGQPPLHTAGRMPARPGMATAAPGEQWQSQAPFRSDVEGASYRNWGTDPSYPTMANQQSSGVFGGTEVEPSLRPPVSTSSLSVIREPNHWYQPHALEQGPSQTRYAQEPFSSPQSSSYDGAAGYYQQQSPQSSFYQGNYAPSSSPPPQASSSTGQTYPRNAYTRTLVGPLSSNACRLNDEHRKPGIFFLFQDLSVRTEGQFRLRLRLMNVGAPPAPESGAIRVHTESSPVLAQTFTEPFVVYSAKRFPGVPDTTALSIAFGNQGQKLPLRNRHGPGRSRRNHQGESDGSDDSDEA